MPTAQHLSCETASFLNWLLKNAEIREALKRDSQTLKLCPKSKVGQMHSALSNYRPKPEVGLGKIKALGTPMFLG